MWNRHRESKNTKLYEIGSGTKLFITFGLKVIRHEERVAQSFYADFSICPPPRAAPSRKLLVWSRRPPKVTLLPLRQELNSLLFLKSQSTLPVRVVTHIPWSQFLSGIFFFFFDISEWHILSVRAWTPALMLHLTNPCAKRKVLSLTKPKGKIYKTKSPRNYYRSMSFRHTFNNICRPKTEVYNNYNRNIEVFSNFCIIIIDIKPYNCLYLMGIFDSF